MSLPDDIISPFYGLPPEGPEIPEPQPEREAPQDSDVFKHLGTASIGKRAILYLRVSTKSQVNTDWDPEGISIPAQRASCQRKAEQLGITIVGEYTEMGQSATETTKRVAFNQMLERIRRDKDVDQVIVYKLSRLARNRIDDAMTMAELQKRGVELVSATEQIDSTPVGQLMHGILSSFNEFRSREDGADIAYKMGQKAKNGGTLGKAPIGYLNTLERIDGREIRSVGIDEQRAPLVQRAFELFATGEWKMEEIVDELADLGLTTKATQKFPSKPISRTAMSRVLRDDYYIGNISYKGETYKGRHTPIIDPELFNKVQDMLIKSGRAGERKRVYPHYLKGTLYCIECYAERSIANRMLVQRTIGKNKEEYYYFFCRGRQHGGPCTSRHLNFMDVEDLVIDHYSTIRLRPEFVTMVRDAIDEALEEQTSAHRQMRSHVDAQLNRISVQLDNLIDLAADGGIAASRVRAKMLDLEAKKERLEQQLKHVDDDLTPAADYIRGWLELLSNPKRLYADAPDELRRTLNQAFFKRIYVGEEGRVLSEVAEQVLILLETQRSWLQHMDEPLDDAAAHVLPSGALTVAEHTKEALQPRDDALFSSKTSLVPLEGLEPPTLSLGRNCSSIELQRLERPVYESQPWCRCRSSMRSLRSRSRCCTAMLPEHPTQSTEGISVSLPEPMIHSVTHASTAAAIRSPLSMSGWRTSQFTTTPSGPASRGCAGRSRPR